MATPIDPRALEAARAEHDDLARKLEVRVSVDFARRGLLQVFVGLIATGFAVKLGWDRWGPLPPEIARRHQPGPPVFLWIAVAVTIVLLALGIRSLLRSRRLAREEDRLFARLKELRAALGLDR
jgi:heme exporter protein D